MNALCMFVQCETERERESLFAQGFVNAVAILENNNHKKKRENAKQKMEMHQSAQIFFRLFRRHGSWPSCASSNYARWIEVWGSWERVRKKIGGTFHSTESIFAFARFHYCFILRVAYLEVNRIYKLQYIQYNKTVQQRCD
jgi:hypothetical protein